MEALNKAKNEHADESVKEGVGMGGSMLTGGRRQHKSLEKYTCKCAPIRPIMLFTFTKMIGVENNFKIANLKRL